MRKPRQTVHGEWQQIEVPTVRAVMGAEVTVEAWKLGSLRVLITHEPQGLHLSISHPGRYPTWDEITHARYRLLPADLTFAMLLPPEAEYVNVAEGGPRAGNIFHLHEMAPGEIALPDPV